MGEHELREWNPVIRFGLCCIFHKERIRFRTTTATALVRLTRNESLAKLSEVCLHNARSLHEAIDYCVHHGIGSFRVMSGLLPLRTHPVHRYNLANLPDGAEIIAELKRCGDFAGASDIRLTFHPDQFVVLNSPRPDVVASSIAELEHHADIAELIGADVINIHAGGVYGDKDSALDRLELGVRRLSDRLKQRLTLENDDRCYSPVDLLPFCWRNRIPLVYDVHHHRCLPDGFSVFEATAMALSTWNREPLFHISSPLNGWFSKMPQKHHDFIAPEDFPAEWLNLQNTDDVEAKAKEEAIALLRYSLSGVLTPHESANVRCS